MAVGNAVLDVMLADGFLAGVDRVARLLWDRLQVLAARYPAVIEEVRGAGLMLGLKCRPANTELMAELRERGLLTVPAGDNVVRLVPPLIIGEEQVEEAVDIIERACAAKAEAA